LIEIVRGSFQVSAGEAEKEITRKLETGLRVLGLQSLQNLGLLLNLLGLKVPDGALTGLDGVLIGLRTRELLQQLLEAGCRLSVVMIIEDLQWIDSVSALRLAAAVALAWTIRSGKIIAILESGSAAHAMENALALSLMLTLHELETLDAAHPLR
jgi:predicted ATPase